MTDITSAVLPDLSLTSNTTSNTLSLNAFQSEHDFLSHPWTFTNCEEFCQEFGIRNKIFLQSVFEKIKQLSADEEDPKIFERLYQAPHLPIFLKKIIAFPEFTEYLSTQTANHCFSILTKRIEACENHKKQLTFIIDLFKKHPTQACLAFVRFTHSVDTLPIGEEKKQLIWLLEQTKQAWYKENYLVSHALTSPFLQDYLNTHPHWTPCVDFVLTLIKEQTHYLTTEWENILGLAHYNTPVFCEILSQSPLINQLDLSLFNSFVSTHPDNLDAFLNLSQHHAARFTVWAEWICLIPEQAAVIFCYWQNHLVHLSDEMPHQEKALTGLLQSIKTGALLLSSENTLALEILIQNHFAVKQSALTNREKDKLPEAKRYLITEMVLLLSVKITCWAFGAGIYMPALLCELYNQKIAPKIGTQPTPETGFDPAYFGMYAAVGKPLAGNRIFEYSGQDNFKQTFLNGFKLFKCPEIGKQYFEHLNRPQMTDTEFYKRVLAKP